ncbi:MAG TPA: HEAT repeat domain-containing protein [Polyangia bacterium]
MARLAGRFGSRFGKGFWAVGGLAAMLFIGPGCEGDPNDPRTWAKQLGDVREQKAALDRIANMEVEQARPVVPELIALYKETRSADHLQALTRYLDPRTKEVFIDALDYNDEQFDKAIIAAGVLGEMKAVEAVDPLIKAAEKELPIKSRANQAKLAAIRALVKIGDKRAVPVLVKILETSANEQDFLLNQRAALGLAEMRAQEAIPALIKGLFMTGRGTDIFQECRLGLVKIGQPSVPALIELFQNKNADVRKMSAEFKFDEATPGIVPYKAAYLLGDLRAPEALPLMVAALGKPARGQEHSAIAIALGQIGTPDAVAALVEIARNGSADPRLRISATDALYMAGDKRALPTLLDIAQNGYVTVEGQKISELRANAAVDYARLGGAAEYPALKALADKEQEAAGLFAEAVDRLQVARDCGDKVDCYGKALSDPAWTRAEKGAFALAFSGDKAGIPHLLGSLKPLSALPQERYPVHQAVLFALTRLADKSCTECSDKLLKQIERDEKAVRLPGARGLLAETRVALATIENTEPGAAAARKKALASADALPAGDKGKGKAKGGKAAKGKKKKS